MVLTHPTLSKDEVDKTHKGTSIGEALEQTLLELGWWATNGYRHREKAVGA
jgi:hypothetical protein